MHSIPRPLLHTLIVSSLLGLALYLAWVVYAPGLAGTFVFDDGPNIVQNSSLNIEHLDADHIERAAFSSDSGMLKRPISMLSFAANASLTGMSPYYFKITNLAIHAVNGISLYFLALLLLQAAGRRLDEAPSFWQCQFVALAVAAAWLLHPFNLTSVLYVVQRMTSLSATFIIWGLIAFTHGRLRLAREQGGYGWMLASLLLFLPLATLTKETGLLLPAYLLVIELTLFQFQAPPSGKRFLAAFFGASVLLPALACLGFLAWNPSWLAKTYVGRSFTLDERVMTEPRILWFYLREIVLPNPVQMGLFHDDIAISRSLLTPVTTLPAILGLAVLLLLSWFARTRAPLISFAILFFFAGHLLESSVWPLELVHEHRNYLPMAGILLALFYYLFYPLKYAGTLQARRFAGVLLIGLLAYGTWSRATHWANPFELAKYDVDNHPDSARDNGEMGNNYAAIDTDDGAVKEAYYQKAKQYYERSAAVDPDYTNGLFALLIVSSGTGREIDPKWVADLAHRLEFSPAEPGIGNKLLLLLQCETSKKCHLQNQTLLDLINAALKNPTNVGARRALVLSSLSYYLVDLTGDYPQALDVLREIVRIDPAQIESRLTLTQFLIAMQKPDEARTELDAARKLDRLNAYTLRIAQIEQQLNHK